MTKNQVYIVHCVDTDKTLYESVEVTFERLRSIFKLELEIQRVNDSTHVLTVDSTTLTFGPQPWLAPRTVEGIHHFDDFDIDTPFHHWQYVFDNSFGTTTVAVMNPATEEISRQYWDLPQSALSGTASTLLCGESVSCRSSVRSSQMPQAGEAWGSAN
jgi:hypothetical protein